MALLLVVVAVATALLLHSDRCSSVKLLNYHDVRERSGGRGYNVSYDNRSFIIDSQRTLLLSGAVHYPRVDVGDWSTVLRLMYEDGLNAVQTYLYWNLHQSEMGGKYDLSGNNDWLQFVQEARDAGLFVVLRIGPFVASEWDYGKYTNPSLALVCPILLEYNHNYPLFLTWSEPYIGGSATQQKQFKQGVLYSGSFARLSLRAGGIPHWIRDIPNVYVRSNNSQWETAMRKFFLDMVELARPLTAPHGGPIILGQVENEFRWLDQAYIDWCGDLVKEAATEIPFLMCNGFSAANTINTYNGNDGALYADAHSKLYPGQPLAWTENEGWFQEWDREPLSGRDNRTPQDMAYVVMKWFARGGAHHNYYMWYGGNNFGRLTGSCITTMYADGVNLHYDMLANEPKKTHLSKLHDLLDTYSLSLLTNPSQVDNATKVLVYSESQHKFVNATYQFAYVYTASGQGVAFLENSVNTTALVQFRETNFSLPGLSSSLVDLSTPDRATEVYNSAKVHSEGLPTKRTYATLSGKFPWSVWAENVGQLDGAFAAGRPLEQLNVTEDHSDYLFYQTTIHGSGKINLTVESRISNSFLVFLDGKLQGVTGYCTHNEGDMNYSLSVETESGRTQQLCLLSVSLGVNTHTEPGEYDLKGIIGDVILGRENITSGKWLHRAQLTGEILRVYTVNGSSNVTWNSNYTEYTGRPLTWYKHTFPSPKLEPGFSLLLDLLGMQRGYVYLNGVNLGRYWLTQVNGVHVQRYYYIPQSLLRDTGNFLVLGEEIGSVAPENVRLVKSTFVVP